MPALLRRYVYGTPEAADPTEECGGGGFVDLASKEIPTDEDSCNEFKELAYGELVEKPETAQGRVKSLEYHQATRRHSRPKAG